MRSERRDSTLPSCPPARTARTFSRLPGSRTCSRSASTGSSSSRGTSTESRRPTRSSRRRRRSASNRPKRPSSRTRWRESRPDAPGASASSSESTAPVSARPCSRTAPTLSSPTWPSCWSESDHPPRLRRRALERPRDAARPERARADGVRVRALERSHRPARQPRRGRALRDPGDLPELVLRGAASPLRRGRLRLPRVRPDGLERDERQDHPPARRRRAVRCPLRTPAGKIVQVDSTRLVSFTHRSAAAILYEVQPVDSALRVAIQSELIANEPAPPTSNDPRTAAMLESPLTSEDFSDRDTRVVLVHSTKRSKLLMAAAMDHTFEGPDGTVSAAECEPDIGRVTIGTDLLVGERLTMVKFLSYGWSSQRSLAAVRDQVIAAVAKAKYAGWDSLLEGQRAYLDDFWATADVELEGDTELQQAVRFALFHTLQAGSRAEQRAIP